MATTKLTDDNIKAQWFRSNRTMDDIRNSIMALCRWLGFTVKESKADQTLKIEMPGTPFLPLQSDNPATLSEDTLKRVATEAAAIALQTATPPVPQERPSNPPSANPVDKGELEKMIGRIIAREMKAYLGSGGKVDIKTWLEANIEVAQQIHRVFGPMMFTEADELLKSCNIVKIFNNSDGTIDYVHEIPGPNDESYRLYTVKKAMRKVTSWREKLAVWAGWEWHDVKYSLMKKVAYAITIVSLLIAGIAVVQNYRYRPAIKEYNTLLMVLRHTPDGQQILDDVRATLRDQSAPLPAFEDKERGEGTLDQSKVSSE